MEALFGLPGAAMAQQQQSSTKKNVAKDAARSIMRDQRGLDRGGLPGTPMPPAHTSHVAARMDQGALPGTHTPLAHTRRAIHAARWRATEIQRLKREEVRLCALIKDTAKKPGGEAAARPLAKQLISLREQQARMSKASTAMSGVASQVRTAGATASAARGSAMTRSEGQARRRAAWLGCGCKLGFGAWLGFRRKHRCAGSRQARAGREWCCGERGAVQSGAV